MKTSNIVAAAMTIVCVASPLRRATAQDELLDTLCARPPLPPTPTPTRLHHRAKARITAEGIEIIRRSTGEQCSSESQESPEPHQCETRQVELQIRTAGFSDNYDVASASVRMIAPGSSRYHQTSGRVDQGGITTESSAIVACPDGDDEPGIYRFEALAWNHRSVSDPQGGNDRRPSYYSDVARFVVAAPPRGDRLVAALRSDGVLAPTEGLYELRARIVREHLLSGDEAREWLSDLRSYIALKRHELSGGVAAMYESQAVASTARLVERVRGIWANLPAPGSQEVSDLWRPIAAAIDLKLASLSNLALEPLREQVRELVVSLLGIEAAVRRPPALATHTNWGALKDRICEVYRAPVHVGTYDLVENELFHEVSTNPARVLEFDRRMGYLARSDDRIAVREGDQVFVRVHGVPAGEPVAVVWDETVVSTTRAERGLDGMPRDGAPPPADPAVANVLRAEPGPSVAHSSLVLRVGEVQSGRYRFSVCRSGSTPADCQRSGHHSLTVHGVRRWGFRAGFGMSTHWSPEVTAIRQGTDDLFLTRYERREADARFAMPFSGVVYLKARQLQLNRFDFGLAAGFDLLNPTTDFHAGFHLGIGPVGLLAAASLSRLSVPNVQGGLLVESDSYPDLGGIFGRQRVLSPGLLLAITFDFDVFRRIYEAIILKGLPAIGGGS